MTGRRLLQRAAAAIAVVCVALALLSSPAWAHNSLVGSEPAEASVVTTSPGQIALRYLKDVPLDTVSLELVDGSGARKELAPARGTTARDVVAPLPPDLAGPLTVRWRLVGPDGHVISARVRFTVEPGGAAAPGTTVEATPAAPAPAPASSETAEASPPLRFGVRLAGFVGATALGGLVAVALLVAPSLFEDRRVRTGAGVALAIVAATAVLGVWILASDIGGRWPGASASDLRTALGLDAGSASLVRLLVATSVAGLLFLARDRLDERTRWLLVGGASTVLFATWSWAGHARAGRWVWLGVPLDVVHYAAASAWLGGLLLMIGVVLPDASPADAVPAVRRFSTIAAASVVTLVVTGAIQGVRLVGGPGRLFGTGHGRLLLAKLLVLGAMLAVANINRKRVQRRFRPTAPPSPGLHRALRRAMVTEAALGLTILAVTAALVVTTPAAPGAPPPQVARAAAR